MPFMIVQRGSQHCVYTQDEKGDPKGDPHGCHPTREKAIAQLRALYANVPEARKTITQAERDKIPAEDFAGPHQSFPIRNQQDVENAAHLVGHADDPEAVKRRIMAICKRKGLECPDAWMEDGMDAKKSEPSDYVIRVGPAVKAMGEGVVGGYLVQFGSDATKDAEGEWFTPETDFDQDFPARASIYYNHGMDPTVGRRRLTHGTMKADEIGVWVEAQLDLRDRHQAAMYGMAKAGKLGWSSGSLGHITDPPRERPGGAIKSWPLGHDASLTPIPSDKRNAAIALKSWEPPPLDELAEAPRSQSLAENTDRWLDTGMEVLSGYTGIAAKAGRKLSAARRSRLTEMRQMIDDLLNETEPQEAASATDSAPPPGMGEGDGNGAKERGIALPASLPDLSDLYAAATRQHDSLGVSATDVAYGRL